MLGALKFNSAKCETTCRLCLGRIKLLKNKRNMQMKAYRKDIADLLRAGKQDYARIRVEAVIREQLTLTAYEILELYLELLSVRSALVATSKEIPRDMVEALSSVLYASSRVPDLPELTTLHKMFIQKYGKEYVAEACSDVSCNRWMVNENLRHCLTIEPPEPALKLETLSEIAQEFGVEWDMDRARRDLLGDVDPMMALSSAAMPVGGPIPGSSAMYRQQPDTMQMPMPFIQQQQQQIKAAPSAGASGAGEYADVAAAAAAAVAAAQQAKNAAVAAARLAGVNGGAPAPAKGNDGSNGGSNGGSSGSGGGGGGGMVTSGPPSGPPAQGWLTGLDSTGSHITPPAAAAAGSTDSSTLQMHPLPSPASGPAEGGATTGTAAGSGYRVPSSEEIQKAYDNAQGPPAKPGSGGGSGTAAAAAKPAVTASDVGNGASAAAAETASGDEAPSADGDLGLPGVPQSGGSAGSGSATNEYDELQKRFEALKKS